MHFIQKKLQEYLSKNIYVEVKAWYAVFIHREIFIRHTHTTFRFYFFIFIYSLRSTSFHLQSMYNKNIVIKNHICVRQTLIGAVWIVYAANYPGIMYIINYF